MIRITAIREEPMEPAVTIEDDAVQTVFVPIAPGRDMMVLMVVLSRDADGTHHASRPYLDDIESAALAMAGRNWQLEDKQP